VRASQFAVQSAAQLRAPALAPVVVGEHAPGDSVQPEPGAIAVRHVVEPPPGREERLGDNVGGGVCILGAAKDVSENWPEIRGVDRFKSASSSYRS